MAARHGVFRQRRAQGGNATLITLIVNQFANNRDRVVTGESDANLNYDQILDPSDDQPGY